MLAFNVLETLVKFVLSLAEVVAIVTFKFADTDVRSVASVSIWLLRSAEALMRLLLSFADTLCKPALVNVLFAM
jgi:hypothetical protein